jgi:predicted RNA-binding Zn ribbon-like protein
MTGNVFVSVNHLPEPGGRAPAPGELAVVQAFINSLDREGDEEKFSKPGVLLSWAVENRLLAPSARLNRRDLLEARRVREALRDLLEANSGRRVSPEAIDILNRASATARMGRVFSTTPTRPPRPGGTTLADLLGQIFLIVIRAKVSGDWVRLKTCRSDVCRWAYYDDSRNRTGQWCAMSICGSHDKMRRYRARLGRHAARA